MNFQPIHKDQPVNFKPKRLIVIGDPHFGVGANDDYFFRSMVSYFRDILIPWLGQNLQPGDLIVFLGDIFDNDTVLRIEIHDAVCALFEKMASLAPIVVIVGNHDVVRKKSNDVNSLRGLGNINGVYVYYQPMIWKAEKDIYFYPWLKDIESLDDFNNAAKSGCRVMISHAHFNGLAFDNEFVKKADGEIKSIDVKDLKMFDLVINGHIHRKQDVMNILNTGSPYQLTYNDDNNVCGFHIIDLVEDYQTTFIENTFSPKFYKDNIIDFLEMTRSEANDRLSNKFARISYPAELTKTFNLDAVRRELHGFVDIDFVPEYNYSDVQTSESDGAAPEVVDLKKILDNVANSLSLPNTYTKEIVGELNESYNRHSRDESLEI